VRKVEVRRSKRRKKTVSAYLEGDTMVVQLPGHLSKAEERHWVAEMERKLLRSQHRKRSPARESDAALLRRCHDLAARYLDGQARPETVRWAPPMRTRWASCTPARGSIRISERLRDVPGWVLDYVLVHELTHLIVPGHDAEFWKLCRRYPKTERAIGYLEGLAAAAGLQVTELDDAPAGT
jgi:predicted metal-dependent hydrolase